MVGPQRACLGPSGRILGACKALLKPQNPSYFTRFSCFGAILSHLKPSSTILSHLKPQDGFQEALKKPQEALNGPVLGPPGASWGRARPSRSFGIPRNLRSFYASEPSYASLHDLGSSHLVFCHCIPKMHDVLMFHTLFGHMQGARRYVLGPP